MAEVKLKSLPANLEPLSPTMKKVMEVIGMITGANDPTSIPLQPGGLMMTGFRTPVGRPDVAARQAATSGALGRLRSAMSNLVLKGQASPNEVEHTMNMANKYPRTMAHVGEVTGDAPKTVTSGGVTGKAVGSAKVGYRSPIEKPRISDISLTGGAYPPSTFMHELTHVGQRAADPDNFGLKYRVQSILNGYQNNAYERGARAVAHPINGRVVQLPNQHKLDPFWQQLAALAGEL